MIACLRSGERISFDIGDVVRLKSGGPPMTITGFIERIGTLGDRFPVVLCQWIVTRKHQITGDAEHVIACHSFDPMTLTKSPQDQTQ